MEDYIPQIVPAHLRDHIDYFSTMPKKTDGNLIPLKKILRSSGAPILM
jgi:hypothetical protein